MTYLRRLGLELARKCNTGPGSEARIPRKFAREIAAFLALMPYATHGESYGAYISKNRDMFGSFCEADPELKVWWDRICNQQ